MADEDAKSRVCAWRLDPEDTFSDWTVIITTTSSKRTNDEDSSDNEERTDDTFESAATKTYHIHKTIVGSGPRCSKYFYNLFKTKGLKESESSRSHIELNESAAAAFPIMLDFIYSHYTVEVQATTETAVALRFLANYFDVPTLLKNVSHFIQKDMSAENVDLYSQEANLFKDEEIANATVSLFADKRLFLEKVKQQVLFLEKVKQRNLEKAVMVACLAEK